MNENNTPQSLDPQKKSEFLIAAGAVILWVMLLVFFFYGIWQESAHIRTWFPFINKPSVVRNDFSFSLVKAAPADSGGAVNTLALKAIFSIPRKAAGAGLSLQQVALDIPESTLAGLIALSMQAKDYSNVSVVLDGKTLELNVSQNFHGASVTGTYEYEIRAKGGDSLQFTVRRSRSNVPLIENTLSRATIEQLFTGAWQKDRYCVSISDILTETLGVPLRVTALSMTGGLWKISGVPSGIAVEAVRRQ